MSNFKVKYTKFFSSKGFYLVLAVALIAVGVAGWSAVSTINSYKNPEETPSYTELTPSYTESVPDTPAQNEVTDEPYESTNQEVIESAPAHPVADVFIVPISGKIQKSYDNTVLQYSATHGDMRLHLGLDISAEAGSEIVASGNGYVKNIYFDALLGNVVEIDHGNGITVKYCGLNETLSVKKDNDIVIGQKIGITDTVPSECGEEPHLHIEVFKDGVSVDPISTLALG